MPIPVTTTTDLAGHLLCAVPQLEDPNFRRSVILMIEHNDEGAFGLVVNQVLPTSIREVLGSLGFTWTGEPEAQVRRGGPVEPIRGFVLHDIDGWDPLADEVVEGVYLTTSLEAVAASTENEIGDRGGRLLFLLGYAGWGAGQLESEMAAGSWVAVPLYGVTSDIPGMSVAPGWFLQAEPDAMWGEALRSTGIDPARVVALSARRGFPT
ncbi:MAG: YqgE/AlgH family protein [Myxococcales bacterium]|nr:YqgE/AlgH family protein [Myxococcales bacterium]